MLTRPMIRADRWRIKLRAQVVRDAIRRSPRITAVSLPCSRLIVSPRRRVSASSSTSSCTSVAMCVISHTAADRHVRLDHQRRELGRRSGRRARMRREPARQRQHRPQHFAAVVLDVLHQPLDRRQLRFQLTVEPLALRQDDQARCIKHLEMASHLSIPSIGTHTGCLRAWRDHRQSCAVNYPTMQNNSATAGRFPPSAGHAPALAPASSSFPIAARPGLAHLQRFRSFTYMRQ
jgi:hypothetical protein